MKIRPVGTELFHAGGAADMMQLTVAFRNFANAPKNSILNSQRTQGAANMRSNQFNPVQTISPCFLYHINL
jgi:hypothetical protein